MGHVHRTAKGELCQKWNTTQVATLNHSLTVTIDCLHTVYSLFNLTFGTTINHTTDLIVPCSVVNSFLSLRVSTQTLNKTIVATRAAPSTTSPSTDRGAIPRRTSQRHATWHLAASTLPTSLFLLVNLN